MLDPAVSALVEEVKGLSSEEAFRLYVNLLTNGRDRAQIAALALRDKARAGGLTEGQIPLLTACLAEAPDPSCVVHFAKALAAFGRKAASAASDLATKIRALTVVDDPGFWILDGCLWSVAYLGGDDARRLLDELAKETPNRAGRSQSVYVGEMTRASREERYAATLEGCRRLVDDDQAGVWRDKKTTLKGTASKPATPKAPSALSVRFR